MKVITPKEAQELANWTGFIIAVDSDSRVFGYNGSEIHQERDNWNSHRDVQSFEFPIRIASDLPWTEQIWKPQQRKEAEWGGRI